MKQNEQKWRLNKGKWWNISRRSILFKCHFVSIEFGRENIHYTSSAFRRKILLYYDKSGQSLHVSRNISVPKSSMFIWTYKRQNKVIEWKKGKNHWIKISMKYVSSTQRTANSLLISRISYNVTNIWFGCLSLSLY